MPSRRPSTHTSGADRRPGRQRLGAFCYGRLGWRPGRWSASSTRGSMAVGMAHGVVRRAAGRGLGVCGVRSQDAPFVRAARQLPRRRPLTRAREREAVAANRSWSLSPPMRGPAYPRSVSGPALCPECHRTLRGHRPAGATVDRPHTPRLRKISRNALNMGVRGGVGCRGAGWVGRFDVLVWAGGGVVGGAGWWPGWGAALLALVGG